VAVGQILIVTLGGTIFKVEPLSLVYWLGVIAFTSTVLIFAEIARRIRLAAAKGKGTLVGAASVSERDLAPAP